MKLKEINPGMVIHCKTIDEYNQLDEETVRKGYGELPCKGIKRVNEINEFAFYITVNGCGWSYLQDAYNDGYKITEFSDLIIPELTAVEILEWIKGNYRNKDWTSCFGKNYCMNEIFNLFGAAGVVTIVEQWIAGHERKAGHGKKTEIETVYTCRIIEILSDGRKRCVYAFDVKPGPELPYGSERIAVEEILKRYCMEHEGEFIAVHEVVSRAKR